MSRRPRVRVGSSASNKQPVAAGTNLPNNSDYSLGALNVIASAPEPASLLLFGTALLGYGARRRKTRLSALIILLDNEKRPAWGLFSLRATLGRGRLQTVRRPLTSPTTNRTSAITSST